jgi:hypothetical protein
MDMSVYSSASSQWATQRRFEPPLQVIYSPDEELGSVFVITAYELTGNAKRTYRRRQRRKPR